MAHYYSIEGNIQWPAHGVFPAKPGLAGSPPTKLAWWNHLWQRKTKPCAKSRNAFETSKSVLSSCDVGRR
jgi:hypothetical protein